MVIAHRIVRRIALTRALWHMPARFIMLESVQYGIF